MSIHFHSLRIKDVKKETDDCVSVTFEIPDVKSDSKLSFRLTVVDNDNLSASDTVNINVKQLKTQNEVSKDDTSCDEIGITNLC